MTPEEMELAKSLLATAQSTTVQGWDILIRGTVINNIINLATVGSSLLISLIVGYRTYSNKEIDNPGERAITDFIIVFVICFIVLFLLFGTIVLGILAPEYTILNRVVDMAGRGC